jgi:hypothetical protein
VRAVRLALLPWLIVVPTTFALAQAHTPLELLKPVIENENQAAAHRECYEYLSQERSERTGRHLWNERIVENSDGRIAMLLAVDGKPLTPAQAQQERDRLNAIAADPADFLRKGQATRNDELHARHMLELLPKDFLFDRVQLEAGIWHMDFHPNPDVSPSAIEDQVLHGMNGTIAIDATQMRLVHIDGKLDQPVTIGMGLLANIHAGSHFSSDRQLVDGHWRTVHVVTQIDGKAALFKSVAKESELTRTQFRYFDHSLSIPEAVQVLLQQQQTASLR